MIESTVQEPYNASGSLSAIPSDEEGMLVTIETANPKLAEILADILRNNQLRYGKIGKPFENFLSWIANYDQSKNAKMDYRKGLLDNMVHERILNLCLTDEEEKMIRACEEGSKGYIKSVTAINDSCDYE